MKLLLTMAAVAAAAIALDNLPDVARYFELKEM